MAYRYSPTCLALLAIVGLLDLVAYASATGPLELIATVTNERGKAFFGGQIALSDDALVVTTADGGEVFNPSTWQLRTALTPYADTSFVTHAYQQSPLAAAGDRLLVSGFTTNATGDRVRAAHLFDTASGDQIAVLRPSDPSEFALWPLSISMDQNHAVVNTRSGVHVFDVLHGEHVLSVTPAQLGVKGVQPPTCE